MIRFCRLKQKKGHPVMPILTRTILLLAGAILLNLQAGCAGAPRAEQLANADYGIQPTETTARTIAQALILARLKDPESARITWGSIDKAWFKEDFGKTRFAWRLPASVNAKNSFGGYVGAQPWAFFFRGDQMVGFGEPYATL